MLVLGLHFVLFEGFSFVPFLALRFGGERLDIVWVAFDIWELFACEYTLTSLLVVQ